MTTIEAFEFFLNNPGLIEKAGLSDVHKRVMRSKLKAKTLKHDTMQKWLLKAGFTERIDWKIPRGYKKPAGEPAGQ